MSRLRVFFIALALLGGMLAVLLMLTVAALFLERHTSPFASVILVLSMICVLGAALAAVLIGERQ